MKIKAKGFTLIELLIVIAIVAILASIAYPAYTAQVQKTRRANAQADLIELASFMERLYGENLGYLTAAGAAPTLPFTESPKDSGNKFYNLSLVAAATTYTLTATPKNGQEADSCGTMTIAHTGVTTPTTANCWR